MRCLLARQDLHPRHQPERPGPRGPAPVHRVRPRFERGAHPRGRRRHRRRLRHRGVPGPGQPEMLNGEQPVERERAGPQGPVLQGGYRDEPWRMSVVKCEGTCSGRVIFMLVLSL
jgi:hypothetical protein